MKMYKCERCGHVFNEHEFSRKEVDEGWTSVRYFQCPNCKAVEYDGVDIFTEVSRERTI